MSLIEFVEKNLKLILPVGGFGFIASISGISSLSSANSNRNDYLFRQISDSSSDHLYSMDNKHFEDLEIVNFSYKDLLNGNNNFNNGNYVIYFGSQACPNCTNLLYGDPTLARGGLIQERDKMSYGAWMKAFEYTKKDSEISNKNIKFLMYEDIPTKNDAVTNDDLWCLPWSTWTSEDIEKGKILGEYKRHDKSAKNFRKIYDYASKIFGTRIKGIPSVIIYKSGNPYVWGSDTLPGLNESEQLPEDLDLKRKIKYYYNWIQ